MEALIDELAALKGEEAAVKARIKAAREELDAMLDFQGKRTIHLFGQFHKATVQRRTDIKWDQAAIEDLRVKMGADFENLFKWEYKHIDKKTLDAYLKMSPLKDDLREAFAEIEGSYYYTFTPLEDQ